MSAEFSSGVKGGGDTLIGHAREIEERSTEEQAERWARALLPYVAAQLPPPATPGAWRASDGVLTPGEARLMETHCGFGSSNAASSSTSGTGEGEGERVIVSVKAPDLGELSLVLDRSGGSVRVLIGVDNIDAIEQMLPEREALIRQLVGSGVSVESVQIVARKELGTLLAPTRFVGRHRASGSTENQAEEEEKVRRRGSRKLNLVG